MRPNTLPMRSFAALTFMAAVIMPSICRDDLHTDGVCASGISSSRWSSDEAHDELAALQLKLKSSRDIEEAKAQLDHWFEDHPLKIPKRELDDYRFGDHSLDEAKRELDEWVDHRMDNFIAHHGNPAQREAHLDAKLGIIPGRSPSAHPTHPEASTSSAAKRKSAMVATEKKNAAVVKNSTAASPASRPSPSNWSRLSGLHLIRWPLLSVGFLGIVGIMAYILALQHSALWSKVVRTALDQQQVPEGIKLCKDQVELKKSIDH